MFNIEVHLDIWLTSVMQNEVINSVFFRIPLGLNVLFIKKNKILPRRNYRHYIILRTKSQISLWRNKHSTASIALLAIKLVYWEHSHEPEWIRESPVAAERTWTDTVTPLLQILAQNLLTLILDISLVIWSYSNQVIGSNKSEGGYFHQRPFRLGENKIKLNSNNKKKFISTKHT